MATLALARASDVRAYRGDKTYECLMKTVVNNDISVERSYELFEKHSAHSE